MAYDKAFSMLHNYSKKILSTVSDTESPDSAVLDVEAERVECPLKISTSTPEIENTVLIYQDVAELTTGF